MGVPRPNGGPGVEPPVPVAALYGGGRVACFGCSVLASLGPSGGYAAFGPSARFGYRRLRTCPEDAWKRNATSRCFWIHAPGFGCGRPRAACVRATWDEHPPTRISATPSVASPPSTIPATPRGGQLPHRAHFPRGHPFCHLRRLPTGCSPHPMLQSRMPARVLSRVLVQWFLSQPIMQPEANSLVLGVPR